VVRQLFEAAELPEDLATRAVALIDNVLDPTRRGVERDPTDPLPVEFRQRLTRLLVEISSTGRRPVMLTVDDAHFADPGSLRFLLHLGRRVRQTAVTIVLAEATGQRPLDPLLRAELLSQPHTRQLRIGPMATGAVATMVSQRLAAPVSAELAAEYHQISGGNPLLVNALLDDHLRVSRRSSAPVVGDAYAQAVLTCMHRGGVPLVRLARALAVLDEPAGPSVIAELLDLDVWSTVVASRAAEAAGLLHEGQFRHQRARVAVLNGMMPEEQMRLRERASEVLHKNGVAATAVARQVLSAAALGGMRTYRPRWLVPVLVEAAERGLQQDDARFALDCLRLAEQFCVDEDDRLTVVFLTLRSHMRLNPANGEECVAELSAAVRRGRLTGRRSLLPIHGLLWYGRTTEALRLLSHVASVTTGNSDTALAVFSTAAQVCYVHPGAGATLRAELTPAEPTSATFAAREACLQAATVVDAMSAGYSERALTDAERILSQSKLDDSTVGPIWSALETLVLAEQFERAAHWCDALLRAAEARRAPTWQALIAARRAMVRFCLGDLRSAEEDARHSLALLGPAGWGGMIGLPLAVLLLANTASGRPEEAARYLRVPVPEAMEHTQVGISYIRARGRYHLSRGDLPAALADFEKCRELSLRGGRDLPGLIPWRSDMAEVLVAMGQPARARDLAQEQVAMLGRHSTRTRGVTLRALARASRAEDRAAILTEAVDALQAAGDRHELAHALADLGAVHHALGQYRQARLTLRRSHHVGTAYGQGGHGPDDATGGPTLTLVRGLTEQAGAMVLSEAECRVGLLAARGQTNRQIARKCNITVSTVEQHLTRVYRKLGVQGRYELAAAFEQAISEPA
jgi:DNA-binding CsgD family transcriptional regulator